MENSTPFIYPQDASKSVTVSIQQPLHFFMNHFIMKAQEVKPVGRRPIGCFHIRAAHNVHKVDVCACSYGS
ncbi:hypothetical protein SELSPUOL_00293 [Selenomonas sputigena ATCC 35185]|uniref:Uncharacterized protein n=1 Tax=Selenomonas sputigena (strain ATCC 35185 / DSM 20758 / CCUG 44933 / VPI D19B-28) TaxID=546271 RepID=C9LS69_SELS3|nr:hypothetical protein SELSPUOL_00293 [Selenomonas sputigena ATCC 35185]